MSTPMKLTRAHKRGHNVDGFGIEILFPGLTVDISDSGIGAIGRIDQARIRPGTVIPMHPHKDDEILTYMRSGELTHRDTVGHVEQVTPRRLMLMNAGHTFQHEEQARPDGEPLTALQIFMRPRAPDLEPMVQFHEFETIYSHNTWRLVAGPEGAPLLLRADAWIEDVRLDAGQSLALPTRRALQAARLLYVFDGQVEVAGISLQTGESLLLDDETSPTITATGQSDLVLFTTDMSAQTYKGGMFSGNVMNKL